RSKRCLIAQTQASRVSKAAEMDVSYFSKYVSGVVEQRATKTRDWKNPQRHPVLDVGDRHDIAARRLGLVKTEAPQGGRPASEVSLGGRQLGKREFTGDTDGVIPAQPHRHRQ